jgi:hypothetical protein
MDDPKKINEQTNKQINIIRLMQTLALSWNIKETYILKEIGFLRPVHPVHAHGFWRGFPDPEGISSFYCLDCKTILALSIHHRRYYRTWFHLIEPMYSIDNGNYCLNCSVKYNIHTIKNRSKPYNMDAADYWFN